MTALQSVLRTTSPRHTAIRGYQTAIRGYFSLGLHRSRLLLFDRVALLLLLPMSDGRFHRTPRCANLAKQRDITAAYQPQRLPHPHLIIGQFVFLFNARSGVKLRERQDRYG
eukprot:scaffold173176_cov31-Tisochrysis_lutea.AAC.4